MGEDGRGYIVLMDGRPAQWLDDGCNYGFYYGRHATTFASRGIAKRRVRWVEDADAEWNEENPEYPRSWRYSVLLVRP